MEEKVREELDSLKRMVLNWRKSYEDRVSPEGEGEFLVQEFFGEVETYVYPYVKRLYACNYLSEAEAREFLDSCYTQVKEFHDSLMEVKTKK
jgi:hypothetical protein